MQDEKRCWFCGKQYGLERHHILGGTANRRLSEAFGLWIWCCHEDHTGVDGVQYNREKNLQLKAEAQMAFEALHGHQAWMNTFRRNYLSDLFESGG